MIPEKILELSYFQQTRILLTAVELEIFSMLDEPSSASDVAGAGELDAGATGRLLDALAAMDVLMKDGTGANGKYSIPEELSDALGDGPQSIVPMLKHRARLWKAWSSLTEVVKTGKDYYELHKSDSDQWENLPNFIRAMAVSGRKSAKETVESLELAGVESVLDIGGGPGIYAAEFCSALPEARVRILDFPGVESVANEFLSQSSCLERVSFIEGSALVIETSGVIGEDGSGKFDVVFMSNLIHSMSPDEIRNLFARCAEWCVPGGRIIVKDFFLDDTRTRPSRAALFGINMLVNTSGGNSYTWNEIESWLEAVRDTDGNPAVRNISRIELSDGYSGIIVAEVG